MSFTRSLALIASFTLAACSGPGDNNANNTNNTNNSNNSNNSNNTTGDAGVDSGSDSGQDMGELGEPCTFQNDCAEDEVCVAGHCAAAPECESPTDTRVCSGLINALEDGRGEDSFCDGSKCRISCVHDTDCAAGEQCTDYGLCRPFTGQITGDRPGGDARAPLQAGVGNELIDFPIGLSLGGYGGRGDRTGRYAESLGASQGQAHGLYARAVVLDNGERQMMFIRMPIIFPTAALHEEVARALQERTGKDWRDSLIISGTHTHSGPARFLQLPSESAIDLGIVGTDRFRQEAFDWIAESTSRAAFAALDDLAPARLGWKIVEAFDNDDVIASDRWGATPPFDDNRLLLMRIDDPQGAPRALMFSYGVHGTFYGSDYATGDSAAAAERGLEAKFGEVYGRHVPTLFFNENGGSMSPRGDRKGHREIQKFEYYGYALAQRSWDEIESITTDDDVTLAGASLRFPMTLENLGYGEREFVDLLRPVDLKYGGFQCSVAEFEDGDYETKHPLDEVKCLSIARLLYNRPANQFMTATISAFEVDGLTVVTMPGEVTMELGWQVLRDVRDAHGVDPLDAFVFGYAQDHHFYLTPSNLRGELPPFPGISLPQAPEEYPDYALSYFQGGYEPSFSLWGWRMGDFLAERAVEAVGRLKGDDSEPEFFEPLPLSFSRITHDEQWVVESSDPSSLGREVVAPPAQVSRLTPIEFGFTGGDPGAEAPQAPRVVLMREQTQAVWAPVQAPSARDYDNREPLMLTRVRKSEAGEWEWLVYWEETKSFPTGRYRFDVEGHYLDADGNRQPYTTSSTPFLLLESDQIEITANLQDGILSGTFAYPAAANLEYIGDQADGGRVRGAYRMRHPDVGSGIPDPVLPSELTISGGTLRFKDAGGAVVHTIDDVQVREVRETVGGRADVPVTRFSVALAGVPASAETWEIEVVDDFGNSGVTTGTLP